MRSVQIWIVAVVGVILIPAALKTSPQPQSASDFDHGPIAYSKAKPTDPVARLQEDIDSGKINLEYSDRGGYLPAVLRALKVPESSQTLVFSKTSLQFTQITTTRPRALYFNDDVYVGFVQGSTLLEFAAVDPKLGGVFYTMEQDETKRPEFQREVYACLICHDSSGITGGVPGFMTLSVLPDREGNAIRSVDSIPMSDQTPFNQRWGGWYVSGTHGKQLHRGNSFIPLPAEAVGNGNTVIARRDWSTGANVTNLQSLVNTTPYLTPDSDIVALMLLTHQSRIHNLTTRAHYDVLNAMADEEKAYKSLVSEGEKYSAITRERIRGAVEPLVRGMFFAYEAEWTSRVRGASTFAEDFEAKGIRDSKGRSLKDLDLSHRLLRYPLSYLIYADAFEALPAAAREYFYERARTILTGEDQTPAFAGLSQRDRTAIGEILTETKPEFAKLMRSR